MAPLLPLPSEISARPTGSSEKNLHRLPAFLEEGLTVVAGGRAEGGNWHRARDFLLRRGRPVMARHFTYRSAASYPLEVVPVV
jgi:hypothetical protein